MAGFWIISLRYIMGKSSVARPNPLAPQPTCQRLAKAIIVPIRRSTSAIESTADGTVSLFTLFSLITTRNTRTIKPTTEWNGSLTPQAGKAQAIMCIIKLPTGVFEFDPTRPLGKRGGFGQVFLGKDPTGKEVAVKKLHLTAADAAHRELRIADELKGRPFEHVVPFIDAGEDPSPPPLPVVLAFLDCHR